MSTSSYSASPRFRAASSTHFATSADFRFGRVLPVMIPTLSIGASSDGRAELLEQRDQRRALALREPTGGPIHHRLVTGEYPGRVLFARRRQPNDASPPVARVGLACDQSARLEPIHGRGDRSAGELD